MRFGAFVLRLTLHKKWNGKKHLNFCTEAPPSEICPGTFCDFRVRLGKC